MADGGHSRRWAVWHHQFDLVRASDGERYLSRWWLVKIPWGGIALHRMGAPDPRATLHDHPFAFVSLVLRGGYVERRRDPLTLAVDEHRVVRRGRVMRRTDAHSIRELLRVPTWTLVLAGPHRRKWGFWEPRAWGATLDGPAMDHATHWRWTPHDQYDSGNYESREVP